MLGLYQVIISRLMRLLGDEQFANAPVEYGIFVVNFDRVVGPFFDDILSFVCLLAG